jgi:hypothetical protein
MVVSVESIKEQIPYYLAEDKKTALAKALADFPDRFDYYISRYEDEVLQGDGWFGLSAFNFESAQKRPIKGIILSNSCDIDPENRRDLPVNLTFAPIVKLSSYVALLKNSNLDPARVRSKLDAIRLQKVTSCFYLPKGGKLEDEYVALLDDVHSLPFSCFSSQEPRGKLFTLSQAGFYMFLVKLSLHFCRFHEEVER